MVRDKLTVVIAPEGTRTAVGVLGPFKAGVFHLALESKAPIVPLVIHGAEQLQPRGQYFAHPGTVVARILRPISTQGFREDNLTDQAADLRQRYLTELKSFASS